MIARATTQDRFCDRIYDKITHGAEQLVPVAQQIEKEIGIPIINKRISVTPIAIAGGALSPDGFVKAAKALDRAADTLGINFIGGFGALVQKGMTTGDRNLIDAIPEALACTGKVWLVGKCRFDKSGNKYGRDNKNGSGDQKDRRAYRRGRVDRLCKACRVLKRSGG